MNLPEICVKRPVFASVLSLILLLFGIVGYFRLSVSELPDIEFPIVSITTRLPGASPEIVDETVTDPIEAELNTIEGVKHIKSQSFEGFSSISVEFDQNRKIDQAAQDCRDALARLRRFLPSDIEEPIVEKLDIKAFPVMWLAVSSDRLPAVDISRIADQAVKEKLQKVKGVGSIVLAGEKKYALRVHLDHDSLYANQLTVNDVVQALALKNSELPSGRIEGVNREFSIKTNGRIGSLDELGELIIAKNGPSTVRLSDIGTVVEDVEDDRSVARLGGRNSVGLGIIKQPQANTLEVAEAVKKEIEKLNKSLSGAVLEVAFDSSEFIQQSIDEVKETLWSSTLLVVLCIFLFLRNFRSTLIPALAIPISVVSTFAAMYFLEFTLNNFTLLALVLAIGVVVDDAIVMLENIFRHIEAGKPRLEAALIGAKEITLPIISASLALIAVFIPIAFMKGQVGQFFFEFGLTVAIAIASSAFVSLTLAPMLCSRLLKHQSTHGKVYHFFETLYSTLENGYKKGLEKSLKRKYWFLLGGATLVVGSVLFISKLGKEFVPDEDRGSFVISLHAPEGSTLGYTDHYLKKVESLLSQNPSVDCYFAALALQGADLPAVNKGLVFVQLKKDSRREPVQTVMATLRNQLQEIVGVDAWPITFSPFSYGGQTKAFEYTLANQDYDELKRHVDPFVEALKAIPGFKDVGSDLEENRLQITLTIDRDKAEDLGVSIQDISRSLNFLLTGKEATKYRKEGERHPVIVQIDKSQATTPDVLNTLYLRSTAGKLVRLDQVAVFTEEVGPSAIHRRDRRKVVTVSANLDGITLKEAVEKADALSSNLLPPTFTPMAAGIAEEMIEAFLSFFVSLILAILIIYLILAAQFESFVYPATIMVALPLSLIGALGGLFVFHMTLNIYSLIGMMMLMGLVTKNAILLVDCTNHLRAQGMEIHQALCEAGRLRLRPILMTATSTIFGIMPIAFSFGAGAESRRPLGVCVIGGMLSSTILTLFIIPAFYLMLDTLLKKFSFLRKSC